MRVAFDSNILVYLARVQRDPGDTIKIDRAQHIILSMRSDVVAVAPLQVLGEAYHVMSRRGYARERCRAIVNEWSMRFETVASDSDTFLAALDLATEHNLQFWDALILNVAADARCHLLLSEDMQEGFAWRGVTVINPVAEKLDVRLVRLLDAPR